MKALRIALCLICPVLWAGWYYIVALGCGFSNGQTCGPFQGNAELTVVMVWAPLAIIVALFMLLGFIEKRRKP